ncbi:TIGR04283 family arsenosugar biosynthesis glycosyltransferase [Mucilaginibacter sp.]|uniref:TIGR04283 family arsenosugar biosynthesis glycosyltransferase n=1 Tax=Mucilaginibacter sp. TaxID=1882438 RepID=UPI003AFFA364
MTVSIIIPTFNEAENIGRLVHYLKENADENLAEIIVSDGGSADETVVIAQNFGAKVVKSPEKGRASQMNFGASLATGDLFYFVHADTIPPKSYLADLIKAVQQGYQMGRYLSRYDSKSWLLKINALLSRIDTFAGMGGDQTLFITQKLFAATGGFDDEMKIMEEFEFSARARKKGKYKIILKPVLISARKYDTNGWLKVQKANYTIVRMYQKGASQQDMVSKYKQLLNAY